MAKDFNPEELSGRAFIICVIGVGLYVAAVLLFVM